MIELINMDNPNAVLPEDRKPYPMLLVKNSICFTPKDKSFIYMDNDCRIQANIVGMYFQGQYDSKYKIVRFIKSIKLLWRYV